MIFCARVREEIFWAFFWVFHNQFFAHVYAGSNILFSFRALYFWNFAQVTAGSNVLGSFMAFCYKFYEQVTTGANVWRFLVYHVTDMKQTLCRSNCYISFSVFYHWFCVQMTARAVMISRVTGSRSGMCGVLAFVLFLFFD